MGMKLTLQSIFNRDPVGDEVGWIGFTGGVGLSMLLSWVLPLKFKEELNSMRLLGLLIGAWIGTDLGLALDYRFSH